MLPKESRLNLKKDFKWVASGKKSENQILKLFLRLGDNQTPRVGIATSSKVFKKAVQRNRARRLISQALRNVYSTLPSGLNMIILPKQEILDKRPDEIELLILELLRQNNLG